MDKYTSKKVSQVLPAFDDRPRIVYRGLDQDTMSTDTPYTLEQMLNFIRYHRESSFLPSVLPNIVLRYLEVGGPEAQAAGDLIVQIVLTDLMEKLKYRGAPRHCIVLYILLSHRKFKKGVVPEHLGGFAKILFHNGYPLRATVSEMQEVLREIPCDCIRHVGMRTLQRDILYNIERQQKFYEWWNPNEWDIVVKVWTFPNLEDAWNIVGRRVIRRPRATPAVEPQQPRVTPTVELQQPDTTLAVGLQHARATPAVEPQQPRETHLKRSVSGLVRKVSRKVGRKLRMV